DRRLRRQPAVIVVLHVDDGRQDAADAADGAADPLRPVHHSLQGRSRPLLDDDESLDRRPGSRHAPADAEDAGREHGSEALIADAAASGADNRRVGGEGRDSRSCAGQGDSGTAAATTATARCPPTREAQEEGPSATLMPDDVVFEAEGETVGEAKWLS